MAAISVVEHGVAHRRARTERVVLRLWGFTGADVVLAEQSARRAVCGSGWVVADVLSSSEAVCPIPSYDPIALKQGADYDRAWAVYRVGR